MINLENLKKIDTRNVAFELLAPLKKRNGSENIEVKGVAIAYALYCLSDENIEYSSEPQNNFEELDLSLNLKSIVKNHVSNEWDIVKDNLKRFSKEELASFILFNEDMEVNRSGTVSTPRGISKLVCNLLDIKDGENVLELCSGKGGFLTELLDFNSEVKYCGIELNYNACDIAHIKAAILGCDAELILHDALTYRKDYKWDKLFSNYPFMVRNKGMDDVKEAFAQELDLPIETIKKASSDWLFNLILLKNMKEDAKAVAIMTNGSTWNRPDKAIRQYFVENGYIEMVISLPGKMFKDTAIPTTLMVLSKNNKKIKLIDAQNIYTEERRYNTLSGKNIADILELSKSLGKNSVEVEIQELEKEDFVLNPVRYIDVPAFVENGVEFGSIALNIIRGAQIKADALEKLKASKATNKRYLMVSNISNGMISIDDDQYLQEIPKNLEKYCIKNNSLVLTKTGNPGGKSAVVHVSEENVLLAHGNVFIIEIDQTKADPYYVQAYLSSENGSNTLKSVYNGAIIRTLSIDSLKRMIIPLPPLETQKHIANKYAATMDEVILLKRKLEKATNKLKSVFDEEV